MAFFVGLFHHYSGSNQHGNQACRVIGCLGANDDFNILVEQGNEVQETLGREATQFEVAQLGYMGLGDAENFCDTRLDQLAILDQVVEAHCELDT